MKFDMFLNTYCSDRIKAKYSILNNIKYIPLQFLHECTCILHHLHNDVCSIEYILNDNYIHINKLDIHDIDNFTLISQLSEPLNNIIEYLAYPPNIIIKGSIKVPPLSSPITYNDRNQIYIIQNGLFNRLL